MWSGRSGSTTTECHTRKAGRRFLTSGRLTPERSATAPLIYRYQPETAPGRLGGLEVADVPAVWVVWPRGLRSAQVTRDRRSRLAGSRPAPAPGWGVPGQALSCSCLQARSPSSPVLAGMPSSGAGFTGLAPPPARFLGPPSAWGPAGLGGQPTQGGGHTRTQPVLPRRSQRSQRDGVGSGSARGGNRPAGTWTPHPGRAAGTRGPHGPPRSRRGRMTHGQTRRLPSSFPGVFRSKGRATDSPLEGPRSLGETSPAHYVLLANKAPRPRQSDCRGQVADGAAPPCAAEGLWTRAGPPESVGALPCSPGGLARPVVKALVRPAPTSPKGSLRLSCKL